MENSDSDFDPKMAAAEVFETIINHVKLSNLNFRMEITPFSASIIIKKSLIKDKSGYHLRPQIQTYQSGHHVPLEDDLEVQGQVEKLKKNCEKLSERNDTLELSTNTIKADLVNALRENESKCKVISDLKNALTSCDSKAVKNNLKINSLEKDLEVAIVEKKVLKQKCKLGTSDLDNKTEATKVKAAKKTKENEILNTSEKENEIKTCIDENYNVKVSNFFSPLSDQHMAAVTSLNSTRVPSPTPPPPRSPSRTPPGTPPGKPPNQVTSLGGQFSQDSGENSKNYDFKQPKGFYEEILKKQRKMNDEFVKKMREQFNFD